VSRPFAWWALPTSSARSAPTRAARLEAEGWDAMGVTDSQNHAGDAWVALTAAAAHTTTLELGTAVTNPVTRHPAVTAAAVVAGDRVSIGIGRGDSALAHLGRAPASVAVLDRYVRAVRAYLAGETVAFDDLGFHETRS
jgi:5,10-methylenetetrahydromethanopterin reductase